MDLLQTLLVYMTVAVSSTIGAAPMPTATPVPTAAPTAVVTAAPVTEVPVTLPPATPTPAATARPQITTNPGYEILRPKMEGEAVKKMQQDAYHILQAMNGIHPGDPTYNEDQDPENYKKTM